MTGGLRARPGEAFAAIKLPRAAAGPLAPTPLERRLAAWRESLAHVPGPTPLERRLAAWRESPAHVPGPLPLERRLAAWREPPARPSRLLHVERRLAAWRAPAREPAHLLPPLPFERRLAAWRDPLARPSRLLHVERRLAAWRAPSPQPPYLLEPTPLERHLAASRATVNPALPSRRLAYKPVAGERFIDGPSAADVRQADVADCYYLAGLAAVAHICRECIESMIRPGSKQGRAIARIFKRRPNSTRLEPRWYEMEPNFPYEGGKPWVGLPDPSEQRPELWAAFGEKAYAKSQGGYGGIHWGRGESGPLGPQSALEAITGMPAESYSTKRHQAELWDRLVDASRGRRPIIAATPSRQKDEYEAEGIYAKHCYPVLDVSTAERSVKVRNIWGYRFSRLPEGPGNPAEFWLPFDQFVRMFQGVAIGSPLGSPGRSHRLAR